MKGGKLARRSMVLSGPVALSVSEPAAVEPWDLVPLGTDQLYHWGRGCSPAYKMGLMSQSGPCDQVLGFGAENLPPAFPTVKRLLGWFPEARAREAHACSCTWWLASESAGQREPSG